MLDMEYISRVTQDFRYFHDCEVPCLDSVSYLLWEVDAGGSIHLHVHQIPDHGHLVLLFLDCTQSLLQGQACLRGGVVVGTREKHVLTNNSQGLNQREKQHPYLFRIGLITRLYGRFWQSTLFDRFWQDFSEVHILTDSGKVYLMVDFGNNNNKNHFMRDFGNVQ